jgi:hypothetical protein
VGGQFPAQGNGRDLGGESDMVGFPVVCPVCGAREELEARTPQEVCSMMTCAIPACPNCGWAREEDRASPVWDRFEPVYGLAVDGREVKQSMVEDLAKGIEH